MRTREDAPAARRGRRWVAPSGGRGLCRQISRVHARLRLGDGHEEPAARRQRVVRAVVGQPRSRGHVRALHELGQRARERSDLVRRVGGARLAAHAAAVAIVCAQVQDDQDDHLVRAEHERLGTPPAPFHGRARARQARRAAHRRKDARAPAGHRVSRSARWRARVGASRIDAGLLLAARIARHHLELEAPAHGPARHRYRRTAGTMATDFAR